MRSNHMQVVHVAHKSFVARAASVGELRAGAPCQRYKLLCNRLDECHARNRRHLWRLLKCLRPKRSHALFDGWETQRPNGCLDSNFRPQRSLTGHQRCVWQAINCIAARVAGISVCGILGIKLKSGMQQGAGNASDMRRVRRWARLKAVPPLKTRRNGLTSALLIAASALTTYQCFSTSTGLGRSKCL